VAASADVFIGGVFFSFLFSVEEIQFSKTD